MSKYQPLRDHQFPKPSVRLAMCAVLVSSVLCGLGSTLAYRFAIEEALFRTALYTLPVMIVLLVNAVTCRFLRCDFKWINIPVGPLNVLSPTREPWPVHEMVGFALLFTAVAGFLVAAMLCLMKLWGNLPAASNDGQGGAVLHEAGA